VQHLSAKVFLFSLIILLDFNVRAFSGPELVDPSVHPVVQYLNDHGIKVEIFNSQTTYPIGEPSFEEKLPLFWQSLDVVKTQIVQRAGVIKLLTVSGYTVAKFKRSHLTLDVDHTGKSILDYLVMFDVKFNIQNSLLLDLDLGIDLYRVEKKEFDALTDKLKFWQQSVSKLNELSSIIILVEVGSSDSFSLEYGKMKLNEERYEESFSVAYKKLFSAARFFSRVNPLKKKVILKFELDDVKQNNEFERVIKKLSQNSSSLKAVLASDSVNELSIRHQNRDNKFYRSSLKKLWLASEGAGLTMLPEVVEALEMEISLAEELSVEMKMLNEDLTYDYIDCVEKVWKNKKLIKSKNDKIKKMYLAYYKKSEFRHDTLYVNATSSDSEIEKIIKGIN
jgi:hypothetical protein